MHSGARTSERRQDTSEAAPFIVPVPEMIERQRSGEHTGLYLITLEGIEPLLIAETKAGYIGVPLRCPHENSLLQLSGMVNAEDCTLMCQSHAIAYSLATGEAVKNVGAPGRDEGTLKTFNVTREGDHFVIHSLSEH
jgi:nitrite reductase/ring-hydroxylating ferredoxin subunit